MPGYSLAGRALAVAVGVALSGCDSLPSVSTRFVTGLSSEQRAQAAEIPVYREKLVEDSYKVVGPVLGLSCEVAHDDSYRVSEENAIEELQRATFKAGGNAVMEVGCLHFGRAQGGRNCFRSIECRGIAIRADNPEGLSAKKSLNDSEAP